MKIAVIGASGFVGDAVVRELAMRGHDVTAFARNAANIFSASNVLAVATDVNDADFAARLAGFDAVISAFNGGWTNPNLIADFRRGYAAILAAAFSQLLLLTLGAGFFGGILALSAAMLTTALIQHAGGAYSWDTLWDKYLQTLPIIAYPEGFINGVFATAMVAFHPNLLATFNPNDYLKETP